MGEAFAWGFIGGSSLLLGGLLALRRPPGLRPLGLVMAFGSGVLISAVAYELVEDAFGTAGGSGAVGLGLFAGAFAFYLGDLAIDHLGGEGRKSAAGGQDSGSALAIVLGTVLDAMRGCAGGCKCCLSKPVSFPCLAACCTVLRSFETCSAA
jgi:ZIP family zinc transporter